jgi:hypothetical protein
VEHALELLRERKAAFDFELGEHPALSVVRDRTTVQESFCEMPLVIPLEHVLVSHVSEDGDRLVKDGFDFGVGFLGRVS